MNAESIVFRPPNNSDLRPKYTSCRRSLFTKQRQGIFNDTNQRDVSASVCDEVGWALTGTIIAQELRYTGDDHVCLQLTNLQIRKATSSADLRAAASLRAAAFQQDSSDRSTLALQVGTCSAFPVVCVASTSPLSD